MTVPEQSRDDRLARARAAESARTRRAGDEVLTRSTGRAARSIGEVDSQARHAWAQLGNVDVDTDARLTLAAAIHASRAATMARHRRSATGER
ncbi:hypothetical protein ASF23_12340 [Curtobacterium sp. Leaf261]|nr:hypothetical protein ASF23_12340 [Curtobacterium sp. Leaf261]